MFVEANRANQFDANRSQHAQFALQLFHPPLAEKARPALAEDFPIAICNTAMGLAEGTTLKPSVAFGMSNGGVQRLRRARSDEALRFDPGSRHGSACSRGCVVAPPCGLGGTESVRSNPRSATPSPVSDAYNGASRIYRCLGKAQTWWKFRPLYWQDSPKHSVTQSEMRRAELGTSFIFFASPYSPSWQSPSWQSPSWQLPSLLWPSSRWPSWR
jgi:hypothetical protein